MLFLAVYIHWPCSTDPSGHLGSIQPHNNVAIVFSLAFLQKNKALFDICSEDRECKLGRSCAHASYRIEDAKDVKRCLVSYWRIRAFDCGLS